jgi:hypothetical protein
MVAQSPETLRSGIYLHILGINSKTLKSLLDVLFEAGAFESE